MADLDRRTILAALTAGSTSVMAGCLGGRDGRGERDDPDGDANGDGTNNDQGVVEHDEDPDEFSRHVVVTDVDTLPQEFPLSIEDMYADPDEITNEGAAYLHLTVKNAGEEIYRVFPPYYKGFSAHADAEGIAIFSLQAADAPGEEVAINCIDNPGESLGEHRVTTDEGPPQIELKPDETHRFEYIVSMDWVASECFPTGSYRFERAASIRPLENRGEEPQEAESVDWGFTIELDD